VDLIPDYRTPGAWAEKVDPAYEALSRALVAASPVPLAGRLVVDLGAGTGATSRAIAAAGGRPVALDLSFAMLDHGRVRRPPAAVADICALPLADASVGGAVSAFSLSHVEDPGAVLAEAARVTAAGGPVVAGVFAATGARHPAVGIVDQLAVQRGWAPPPWYRHLKLDLEPAVAGTADLLRLARSAGLVECAVVDDDVDAALDTAEALVGWRLGHPAMAPFVASLMPAERAAFEAEAIDRVGSGAQPLRLTVRMLLSVAPAARSRVGAYRPA
jgi:SAM-dependent methyltransferase